jgi:hypothetical protein
MKFWIERKRLSVYRELVEAPSAQAAIAYERLSRGDFLSGGAWEGSLHATVEDKHSVAPTREDLTPDARVDERGQEIEY